MRFPVHAVMAAVMAAALIVSDVAQAASLSAAGAGDRAGVAAADEARYRRSESSWKQIMTSVCVGCGTPPAPLEIVRMLPGTTRPDTARTQRQAGLDVPAARAASPARAETDASPVNATSSAASSSTASSSTTSAAKVARKRVARLSPRQLRTAARLRKRIQFARLQRLRERRRLALVRRRQEARRVLRLAQTAPDPRGRTIQPASPNPRIAVAPPRRRAASIDAVASAEPSLPVRVPPQTPSRDCPSRREAALAERGRATVCSEDL